MVPLTSEHVDTSTTARRETFHQEPSGGLRSPAASVAPAVERSSRWQRLREHVWAPVALKTAGACLGLSCLALAGAASMQQSVGGIEVSARGTEWLAGEPQEDAAEADGATTEVTASLGDAGRSELHDDASPPEQASPVASASRPEAPKADAPEAEGEAAQNPCAGAGDAKKSAGQGVTADGRIILNVANVSELTRLPGVGERRAEQIVALRERLGKFRRVTDLLRVKGIGPKSLRRLTPLLVLDPPKEEEAPEGSP